MAVVWCLLQSLSPPVDGEQHVIHPGSHTWISFLGARKENDVNLLTFILLCHQNKVGHSHQPHTGSQVPLCRGSLRGISELATVFASLDLSSAHLAHKDL